MTVLPLRVLCGLALLACVVTAPARSEAQSAAPDTKLAGRYFREAQELCSRDGGRLWGVSLCGPMLLVERETRAVVANQADGEGALTKSGEVFVGRLPAAVNLANTAADWAGVRWAMILLPLPEDRYRRAALMAHELWHRVQDEAGFRSSGAANSHLDTREGRLWLQLEWRALEAALGARGRVRREAVADALLFRAYRRSLFPGAAAQEREMELHEGLAEYTGVRLCGSPDPARYVADFDIKEVRGGATFVRSFAYASGPAYGVLLDGVKRNWQAALKSGDDLGALLQHSLGVRLPADIERAAGVRARRYGGRELLASEAERESKRLQLLDGYRARLVEGRVLELGLQNMRMQFDPGELVPLGAHGTIYPNIRIVDAWGILTVSRGALMSPTFTDVRVPAPAEPDARPLRGEGWTLELNEGWTLEPGPRPGDLRVRKSVPK